jgi:hypothetical protein
VEDAEVQRQHPQDEQREAAPEPDRVGHRTKRAAHHSVFSNLRLPGTVPHWPAGRLLPERELDHWKICVRVRSALAMFSDGLTFCGSVRIVPSPLLTAGRF